ncbi:MAG: hypothetical protein EB025_07430 [Chitinophagaceae bacterium]|jgi:hypothetical protein|nr:hypothetical protein [Oxalobacteraceae bacterium]NDB53889.1 hypothetical protein [Chitinophagaceae bacterium]
MRLKSELSSSRARGSVLLFQSVVKARGGWHWGTRFLARHGHQYGPFYKWRAKYGGMDVSMMSLMKELEE